MKRLILCVMILGLAAAGGWAQDLLVDDFDDQNDQNELGGDNIVYSGGGATAGRTFEHLGGNDYAVKITFDIVDGPEMDYFAFVMMNDGTDVSGYQHLRMNLYPEGVADQRWMLHLRSNIVPDEISYYMTDPLPADTWTPLIISLADDLFTVLPSNPVDLTTVKHVSAGNSDTMAPGGLSGMLWIDDVKFTDPLATDALSDWGGLKGLFRKE